MPIVATGQMTLTDMNDAKQSVMYIGASQSRTVIFNGVSTYTPNYASTNQVLTPQVYVAGDSTDIANTGITCKWYYQTNGTGGLTEITTANAGANYTLGTTMPYTLTVKANILASATSMTYICEIVIPDSSTGFNVTQKSEIEIVKITNGTNGTSPVLGVLSNEAHTIPTDVAGANGNFTGAVTTLTIYEGSVISSGWTITQTRSNVTVTEATSSATATVTALSADTGYVEFTATKSGYPNVVKRFNLSKSKQGGAGTSPTAYTLITSADALQKSITNVYTPATISFTAKSQTGSGAQANYNARWVIEDTLDNTNWTVRTVNPTTDEAVKTYTPSSTTIKAVRVKMYLAGGTTTLIDEQTIPVVSDGTNAIYAYVWNPDGNAIKNSTGTLTCHVDVYNGATTVTGTAFKWYIQDPTATTVSGGDVDGGNGWRLLNAGYTAGTTNYATDTLTVPASAVAGTESFKCVVTYNSVKYSGVTTVVDLSDPIVVRIDGANIFKNGEGSVTVRATVLQSGAEIDAGGTTYSYAWSVYDTNNVKTAFAKTGKSITVLATEVAGIGNLVCEISK